MGGGGRSNGCSGWVLREEMEDGEEEEEEEEEEEIIYNKYGKGVKGKGRWEQPKPFWARR